CMKGQVAVETLMTYGWMLLAVGLVSGSLMSSGITSACSGNVNGFGVHQLKVEDIGFSSGKLKLRLLNDDTQGFEHDIAKINISNSPNSESKIIYPSEKVNSGKAKTYSLNGFVESDNCRTLEVSITYDRGNVLENQVASGTVTSYIRFNRTDTASSFRVQNVNAPSEASLGENVDVSADIVSDSGSGSSVAELRIGNDIDGSESDYTVLESKNVNVASGETKTVEFVNVNIDSSVGTGTKEIGVVYREASNHTTIDIYNKPTLDQFVLNDNSENSNVKYDLKYNVSNLDNFQKTRVKFDNLENSWSDETLINTSAPEGSVYYEAGGEMGADYNVTVEVINQEGQVTDSAEITDTADGSDAYYPSDLGEGQTNPSLEDQNITDNSNTNTDDTAFFVEYKVNQTENFQELRAVFDNQANDWSDRTITNTSAPSGTMNYTETGTTGDKYNITLKVINNDGITVDTYSRLVEANGSSGDGGGGDNTQSPSINQFSVTDESRCTGGPPGACRGQDEASYQVDWEATDPNNNLKSANITFNNTVPGSKWKGLTGSETYTENGKYGAKYIIKFQASYTSGVYLCAEYNDTADGSGINSDYIDCS
ncbi:MAG: hypothetical protein ABEK04_00500, partial [Candidatus Nanohalobium sp.]